jgi:hypothetical protein
MKIICLNLLQRRKNMVIVKASLPSPSPFYYLAESQDRSSSDKNAGRGDWLPKING